MPEQTHLITLLLVIPLVMGIVTLGLVNHLRVCRFLGITSFLSMLTASVFLLLRIADSGEVLVSQGGSWPAPFGISLIYDSLSGLLIAAASAVGLAAYIHSFASLERKVERRYFHPLLQFMMLGVNLSFLTGDLFNLFVAFEVMLMASYALLAIGSTRQQMSQAYKYVILNLLASTMFVIAAGLVYGMTGTLNIADLARIVAEARVDAIAIQSGIDIDPAEVRTLPAGFVAAGVTLLLVFGLKGAFFPLWFWLPDTYWTPPIAVAGLFGGILTKVGVYTVARVFPLVFAAGDASGVIVAILAGAAALTMVFGGLGALSYTQVRRMLCMQLLCGVGYMVFGIAAMSALAIAGAVFYMTQHMLVQCAMFLCCGLIERHAGSDDFTRFGGLMKRDGLLALLFFVAAMSLVGLPPLSGFFGKLVIVREGWEDLPWLALISLLVSTMALLSLLRVWAYGFWLPNDENTYEDAVTVRRMNRPAYAAITGLVVAAVTLGFTAEGVYKLAVNAGEQLVDPRAYIQAVMGDEAVAYINERNNQVIDVRGIPLLSAADGEGGDAS